MIDLFQFHSTIAGQKESVIFFRDSSRMENDFDECSDCVVFYGHVYFLTTFASVGVILNLISLFVFYRHSFKIDIEHNTWIYLIGLAVADTLTCLIFIIVGPLKCLHHKNNILQMVWNTYKTFFFWPLTYTFGTVSVWITMVISVDRCLFVTSFGFKHRRFLKNGKIAVVVIFLASALFHIPHWLFFDPHKVAEKTGDYLLSDFTETTLYIIWSWCRIVIGKCVPIIAVVISNTVLIKITWLSKTWTKKPTSVAAVIRQRAQNKMTAMLVSISFMFVICHLMELILYVIVDEGDIETYFGESEHYDILIMTAKVMETLSFASNFVFYCACNRPFSQTIRKMFNCFRMDGTTRNLNAVGQNPFCEQELKLQSLSGQVP